VPDSRQLSSTLFIRAHLVGFFVLPCAPCECVTTALCLRPEIVVVLCDVRLLAPALRPAAAGPASLRVVRLETSPFACGPAAQLAPTWRLGLGAPHSALHVFCSKYV
jgi:hypothetical protein